MSDQSLSLTCRENGTGFRFSSAKSREGSLRTPFHPRRATKNAFLPRSHAKGREKHLLSTKGHEGPRRTPSLSAKSREGSRRTPSLSAKGYEEHLLIREVTRRIAKNTSLSTKGHWDFPCVNAGVSRTLLPKSCSVNCQCALKTQTLAALLKQAGVQRGCPRFQRSGQPGLRQACAGPLRR